jgi:hypothetical protein
VHRAAAGLDGLFWDDALAMCEMQSTDPSFDITGSHNIYSVHCSSEHSRPLRLLAHQGFKMTGSLALSKPSTMHA